MLLFLDDICLPLESARDVERALESIGAYANRWAIEFNVLPGKSAVLPLNGATAPEKWRYQNTYVHTSTLEKYLAVKFTTDGAWKPHFDSRMKAANDAFHGLKSAGLVGGHNTIKLSAEVVTLHIWPILDSGRVATTIFMENSEAKSLRYALDSLQHKLACLILNVARTTSSDAVLAELGWISDILRNDARLLCTYSAMIGAPAGSLPQRVMARLRVIGRANVHLLPPFMQHAHELIQVYRLDESELGTQRWKTAVKRATRVFAAADLKSRLDLSPALAPSFPAVLDMNPMPYLCVTAFQGRQLLTQTRLNCLPIGKRSKRSTDTITCPTCLLHAETRTHWMFECHPLEQYRLRHAQALPFLTDMKLSSDHKLSEFLRISTLPTSEHNIRQIRALGALLTDLWRGRTKEHFALSSADGMLPSTLTI